MNYQSKKKNNELHCQDIVRCNKTPHVFTFSQDDIANSLLGKLHIQPEYNPQWTNNITESDYHGIFSPHERHLDECSKEKWTSLKYPTPLKQTPVINLRVLKKIYQ